VTRPRGLVKRIASVEDDSLVAALKKEWSAAKTSREQAKRRLAELKGIERDLRADQAEVEALLETWRSWQVTLLATINGVVPSSIPPRRRRRRARSSRRYSSDGSTCCRG
jgi:hypothetical protein